MQYNKSNNMGKIGKAPSNRWSFFVIISIIILSILFFIYTSFILPVSSCKCKESMTNASIYISDDKNELSYGAEEKSEIPNLIWTFWDSPNLPKTVEKCIDSWRYYNPGYTVTLLTKQNIGKYLPEINISNLKHSRDSPARFSDFVRLHILAKYGGIWIDSSIICHKPFSWIHAIQKSTRAEFIGYYLDGFTESEWKQTSPVIESWFLAAVPNSTFVQDWKTEFIRTDNFDDIDDYLHDVIDNHSISIQNIQGPNYLTIHVSAQKILQKNRGKYNIFVFQAERGPYQYLALNEWDSERSIQHITNPTKNRAFFDFPIIKMRGCERGPMDQNPNIDNAFSHF